MSERRWSETRNWSNPSYERQLAEAAELEALMRNILKLFSEGCLVYRKRTQRSESVLTKSDRLKRIRAGLVPAAHPLQVDGPAAVA